MDGNLAKNEHIIFIPIERHFMETLWLKHFRMTKQTFEMLCRCIGLSLTPDVLSRRPPLPFKRIAVALYKLATCAEYRVVNETFGVSKTTVHLCVYAVCNAIRTMMMREVRQPPWSGWDAGDLAAQLLGTPCATSARRDRLYSYPH